MKSLLLSVSTIAVLFLVGACVLQRKLIYFPQKMQEADPRAWGVDMELAEIKTSDGLNLSAWYRQAEKGKPTILYLHGNAGNLSSWVSAVGSYVDQGFGVLLLDYRGYGVNPGKPNELGLLNDGRGAVNFLSKKGIPANCIVLHGYSLGGGVAVQLAAEYSFAAVILQSSFSSLVDVAKIHYPFLPSNLLLRDRYDSVTKIKQVAAPKLILHGVKDELVPLHLARKLHSAADSAELLVYENADHNNFPDTFADVQNFLLKHQVNCL